MQASFTWSKSLDTNSSVGTGAPFSNSITGQFLFDPMRGLSDFNVGRTFVLSGILGNSVLPQTSWYGGWQLGIDLHRQRRPAVHADHFGRRAGAGEPEQLRCAEPLEQSRLRTRR